MKVSIILYKGAPGFKIENYPHQGLIGVYKPCPHLLKLINDEQVLLTIIIRCSGTKVHILNLLQNSLGGNSKT